MNAEHDERTERLISALTEAVNRLRETVVVMQERQRQDLRRFEAMEAHLKDGGRLAKLEEKHSATDRKLDQWINRGIGAWALAASLTTLYKFLH